MDIEKGITEFSSNQTSFIKGPNYEKYVNEDDNTYEGGITTFSCGSKGAYKAMFGGAVTGAVGGAGAVPGAGAGAGAVAGGVGYYATCW